MSARFAALLVAALLCLVPVASQAALSSYIGNFESLDALSSTALSGDGWLVYGNVFTPAMVYKYGYGPYPAPNLTNAFCDVATGQGGDLQGLQQLSVYSDYNNTAEHTAGNWVESNTYHEQTVAAGDVGNTWTFQFDAKLGNLTGGSTALAFLKTLNPSAGWTITNFLTVNTTAIPATWNTYSVSLAIDASLVGQLLQFGFANTATSFVSSGVYYDNVVFSKTAGAGVEPRPAGLALAAPSPNPSRGATRLQYSLPQAGPASLSVYDVQGRRVAVLADGVQDAGTHVASWNGLEAAPGVYRCVLSTAAGRIARTVVLVH